ncbi:MAG TPA: NAD(P)H-quinone oxidoreductase [Thermoanaerobaculia bacterium]
MKAVLFDAPGDERVLRVGDAPSPELRPDHLRIRVRTTSVNRADLLQRCGMYPPPPGASPILGLECAGEVIEIGREVESWSIGERAMALLPGGGYAEEAVVHAGSAMHVPAAFSDEEAGASSEVFLTAFLNLFMLASAKSGETALVHGGGSGVGTAAIALCRVAGVRVIVTVGSDDKARRCLDLGAEAAINYRTEDFVERARAVDVILDHLGGAYLERNLEALATGGRLVIIGTMGGRDGAVDVGALLQKRATIFGSTLRARSDAEKAAIVDAFLARFGEALGAGRIRPVIDRVFPLAAVADAHRLVESSAHFGKVVLRMRS